MCREIFWLICCYQISTLECCSLLQSRLKILLFGNPIGISADYFTATIEIEKFISTEEDPLFKESFRYSIQYKPADSENWKSISGEQEIYRSLSIFLSNLEPDTTYYVKVTIISNFWTASDDCDLSKIYYFRTKCDEILSMDTKISNTSVSFAIRPWEEKICKFDHYDVKYVPVSTTKISGFINRTNIYFDDLKPFTNYTVVFTKESRQHYLEIQTLEGVPDAIPDLNTVEISSTEVAIKWGQPINLRGSFKHYIVEYNLKSYLACDSTQSVMSSQKKIVRDNVAIVDNLIPYGVYVFSVSAANNHLEGPSSSIEVTTLPSIKITTEELPIIKHITTDSRTIDVELISNCEKLRGPLFTKISLTCLEIWCNNSEEANKSLTDKIYLANLVPFSNYVLTLKYCRAEENCAEESTSLEFRTEPANPGPVSDLLVFSKNDSSVSLRWKPPYPPNGVLKNYNFRYSCDGCYPVNESEKDVTLCSLWPDFHCTTITSLQPNKEYSFHIYGRNKELSDYHEKESTSVRTVTHKEPSKPPYDIDITWTDQNNLQITWKHPNETNGQLEFFEVCIIDGTTNSKKTFPVDVSNYKLIYNYTTEIIPSTNYTIFISANNGLQGEYARTEITSPTDVLLRMVKTKEKIPKIYFFVAFSLSVLVTIIIVILIFYRKRKLHRQYEYSVEATLLKKPHVSSNVEVNKFYNYVKCEESSQELKKQHQIILEGLNTYSEIYDELRMEHIDINYLSGHHLSNVYIATQIPKEDSIHDLWNIIWTENIRHVVLFGNERNITKQGYWATEDKSMTFGDFLIEFKSCKTYEFYKHRKFTLIFENDRREINHLQFFSEISDNLSSLQCVQFFQRVSEIPLSCNSPILVHGSGGMSGSCFVLLCDICVRTGRKDGVIDVMKTLQRLVEFSPELIIDYDDYVLVHKIISEVVIYVETEINCSSLDPSQPFSVDECEFQKCLEYLEETLWLDCRHICSSNEGETLLNLYSHNNQDDYFPSVIVIDSFKYPEKFFVTPNPTSNSASVANFWKLVDEKNISVVVSLNENMSVWPYRDDSNDITVNQIVTKNLRCYDWITVEMKNRNIAIFSMKNWPCGNILPEKLSDFVNFCGETSQMLNKNGCILVTCQDGFTASGLYITMAYNIQKIKSEGISDICRCTRMVRSQCNNFFQDKKQYTFLLEASYKYIDEVKSYEII